MPWDSASRAVCAESSAGIVVSRLGSVTEMSGTSARPAIVALSLRVVSVMTQNWETSEPEPPVLGTMTIGGMGLPIVSMPS
jgi:hypothetical protein